MRSGVVPRVDLRLQHADSPLSAYLSTAHDLLVEAGRILAPSRSVRPDVVHTVGDVDVPEPGPLPVRTVDGVPLRANRFAVAPGWLRRERRFGAATTWLAHGYTTGRLLLDTDLTPNARLHCLPLLGTLLARRDRGGHTRAAQRTATRIELGLPPGGRLVVTGSASADAMTFGVTSGVARWHTELATARRPDVVVVQLGPARPDGTCTVTDSLRARRWDGLSLYSVFAACDVFVTTGTELVACSAAVTAANWGIPIVATATDSAAELVLTRGRGTVVTGGGDHIARAVLEELDSGLPHAAPTAEPPTDETQVVEYARALLGVYRRVVRSAVIGGAA